MHQIFPQRAASHNHGHPRGPLAGVASSVTTQASVIVRRQTAAGCQVDWRHAPQGETLEAPNEPFLVRITLTGTQSLRFGRRTVQMQPGELIAIPAGCAHQVIDGPDPVTHVALRVSEAMLNEAARAARINPAHLDSFVPWKLPLDAALLEAVERIDERFQALASTPALPEDIALLLDAGLAAARESIDAVARMPAQRESVQRELLRRALIARELLEPNFRGEVGLGQLSREAGLSRFHLHRCFSAAFGTTPKAMQQALRMADAQRLLRTTDLPVGAIALEVGYQNAASFVRQFRLATGETPGTHRGTNRAD